MNMSFTHNAQMLEKILKKSEANYQLKKEFENFHEYLKNGEYPQNNSMQTKDMVENQSTLVNNQNGGYLVPKLLSQEIQNYMEQTSIIRKLANVQTVSGNYQNYLTLFDSIGELGWVDETDNRPTTKTPTINSTPITLFEMYCQPRVTKQLLNDSYVDIASWLTNQMANAFSITENEAFFRGNGTSAPLGILIANLEKVLTQATGVAVYNDLVNLCFSLDPTKYYKSAVFISSYIFGSILKTFTSPSGKPLVYNINGQDMMFGFPIYYDSRMDNGTASLQLPLAFGDFKSGYTIYDCSDMNFIRDDITQKQWVKFYTTKRIGGSVTDGNTIKLLKIK